MKTSLPLSSFYGNYGSIHPMLPARLDVKQTADLLGFQEHDVPVLVAGGMLEPLGKPIPNARKYFARVRILGVAEDPAWLSKATRLIYQHWQGKNSSRKSRRAVGETCHSE